MGYVETEQMVRIIETTSNAIANNTPPAKSWVEHAVLISGAIAAFLTAVVAFFKFRKGGE